MLDFNNNKMQQVLAMVNTTNGDNYPTFPVAKERLGLHWQNVTRKDTQKPGRDSTDNKETQSDYGKTQNSNKDKWKQP